jgi:hypothetical protein
MVGAFEHRAEHLYRETGFARRKRGSLEEFALCGMPPQTRSWQ